MACPGSHTALRNLICSMGLGLMGECEASDPFVNTQVGGPGPDATGRDSHLVSCPQSPTALG